MPNTVTLRPSGKQFIVEQQETILEAGLRHGLNLPYSCSNGTCGDCRGRVIRGQVEAVRYHDYYFSKIEREQEREGPLTLQPCRFQVSYSRHGPCLSGPDPLPLLLPLPIRAGGGLSLVTFGHHRYAAHSYPSAVRLRRLGAQKYTEVFSTRGVAVGGAPPGRRQRRSVPGRSGHRPTAAQRRGKTRPRGQPRRATSGRKRPLATFTPDTMKSAIRFQATPSTRGASPIRPASATMSRR